MSAMPIYSSVKACQAYSFLKLPPEMWLNILSNLDPKDLANFGATCRLNYQIHQTDEFWIKFCVRRQLITDKTMTAEFLTWKTFYTNYQACFKAFTQPKNNNSL